MPNSIAENLHDRCPHVAACQRCGSRLYITPGDFPSCVICGWEDYASVATPTRMRVSTLESMSQLPVKIDKLANRRRG